jgi:dienelactone hydrolase
MEHEMKNFIFRRLKWATQLLLFFTYLSANTGEAQSVNRLHRIVPVTFEAGDGFPLAATYYSATRAAPAVLLLQQCGSSLSRWTYQALAIDLAGSGLHVLTFDFRGSFGSNSPEDERNEALEEIPNDIESGLQYLASRDSVTEVSVVVGASCSASLAAALAQKHSEVRAIAMLSGSSNEPSVLEFLENSGTLVFGIGARDDELMYRDNSTNEFVRTNSAAWLEESQGLWNNPGSRLIALESGAHGMALLVDNLELTHELANWIHLASGIAYQSR